ncbi:hypothetical protein SAMN05216356_105190 [Oribacterium sp. WCC10]|nr:hypothetical protein SAMN05216356_105190 [Oribacterium sp. WCC10]
MSEGVRISEHRNDMARAKLGFRRNQVRHTEPNLTGGAQAGMAK